MSKNKTHITAEPGKQEIMIVREFDAPRELVFKAHTDPELYVQWLGPRGYEMVLEAKREDVDPYDAKEQARGYAENLKAPLVILSNGREHWFWNFERADQRRRTA